METITRTALDLEPLGKGKVRDTYILGEGKLLMVATDRLSAFDVVFNEGIPRKGEVLTRLSEFWFNKTKDIIQNHFISMDIPSGLPDYLKGRSMVVKRCQPLPLECVVRGHITGSAWKEYKKGGTVCGMQMREGMEEGDEFPSPLFTPSTKAVSGHDENITEDRAREVVGRERYEEMKEAGIKLYDAARVHARKCGLVLVDTKFEFGLLDGKLMLIDEAFTPDSSRYWLEDRYEEGILESLDKQYVRDYLEKVGWDKSPPPPALPKEVNSKTRERYLQAYEMLTGESL